MFQKRTLLETTYLDRRMLLADGEGGGDGDAGGAGGGAGGAAGAGDGAGGAGEGDAGGGDGDAGGLAASRATAGGDGSGAAGGEGEGEGEAHADRPDNLPDQFWDGATEAVNIDALVKGFNDTKAAHDRLVGEGSKGGKAPKEAGEYFDSDLVADDHMRLPEGEIPKVQAIYPDGVPTDDPLLMSMSESALKHGLTKQQFLGVVGDYLVNQEGALPDAIDVEGELKALGSRGKDMVDEYNGWIDSLQTEGLLSEQDVMNMRSFGATAPEIQTLRKIMSRAQGQSNNNPDILGSAPAGDGLPSYEEWYAQIPSAKDNPTPADWAKWEDQGERLFGVGPGGTSRSGMGMPSSRGAVLR